MDCNKRKYRIEDILKKVEASEHLEHCEELFYLTVHHNMTEEEAERYIYYGGEKIGQPAQARPRSGLNS